MAATKKPDGKPAAPSVIEGYKQRVARLMADRGTLNSHLEEIAEVTLPNSRGFTGRRTKGEKKMHRVFDETGITANRLYAAGLHGLATNPASKWFSVRVLGAPIRDDKGKTIDVNELPRVKQWRSDVENVAYAELYAPGTGMVPALNAFYLERGAFGTSVLFIGESSTGALQLQARALSECYIAENADGVVDTLARVWPYTVRQVVEHSGWTASDKVRNLYDQGKLDDEVMVCHWVAPRKARDASKKNAGRNMAFVSCYFEIETCHELEAGGFPEFPYVVARDEKCAGETYGRSRGMEALPAVKMLQAIEAETIKIMQKMANPPTFLRDDGVLGAIRTIPGATNFWRGNPNEGVMQLPTSDKMPIALEWVEGIRNRVRTIFHNDTLQIVDEREMTLGEARMRKTERMRLQGPDVGTLDAEMLGPLFARVYAILERKGKIPLAPEEMNEPGTDQSRPITVEFVSPLANAQKQEQLAGMVQIFEYLAPLREIGLAALAKKVNTGRMIDGLWDILQNDPDWLNTPEEQQAIEQRETQMQSLQAAQPAADALNSGAGAVKQLGDASQSGVDINQLMAGIARGAGAAGAAGMRRAA